MSSNGMQGDLGQLTSAAGDADSGAIDLDSMLTNTMHKVELLVGTELLGKTGIAFDDARETCRLEMANLTKALRGFGRRIGDTSLAYASIDEDNAALVTGATADGGSITAKLMGLDD